MKIRKLIIIFCFSCMFLACKKNKSELFLQIQESSEVVEETKETIPLEEVVQEEIVVHIIGQVVNPGVYKMKQGERIVDVIKYAGGFLDDANKEALNLATKVVDGMKIIVPSIYDVLEENEESYIEYKEEYLNENTANGMVNINTADVATLCTLSGVGESRAKSIIAYREQNGAFKTIEEIMNVSGIKEGSFLKIKDSICVE
ncbi:MAG: helix-hairpin-helix domain-containing protein [Lachnospiraceae bacterium]